MELHADLELLDEKKEAAAAPLALGKIDSNNSDMGRSLFKSADSLS